MDVVVQHRRVMSSREAADLFWDGFGFPATYERVVEYTPDLGHAVSRSFVVTELFDRHATWR